MVVDVTQRALDELEAIRQASNPQPGQGITLVVDDNGELGLALAWPQEEDQVIERGGQPVIIIPQVLADPLDGVVIDYQDTPGQEGFTLTRP
ncbi:MAG: adhesin [Sphaerobacter sp.]|nr:adhesin [Sphaerobacter sp.]